MKTQYREAVGELELWTIERHLIPNDSEQKGTSDERQRTVSQLYRSALIRCGALSFGRVRSYSAWNTLI